MSSWRSYPKSFNLGHSQLAELFADPVLIEEKIDGSQFSFGIFNGELKVRSKGKEMVVDAPEKMFTLGVEYVKSIQHLLTDGYTYTGEFLSKSKHNTLAYDRTPKNNIILFDVRMAEEAYMSYEEKAAEAARLGLEVVPCIFVGTVSTPSTLHELLERVSVLGGQKIEGFVVKNYNKFGVDKKALMGKYVSEAFKEIHGGEWKAANPSSSDIIYQLGEQYTTPARWNKSVQHLKERGELTNSPKDIGLLMKEVNLDVLAECKEEIKEALFKYAWPKIARRITSGLPQWYKDELVKSQFEKPEAASGV